MTKRRVLIALLAVAAVGLAAVAVPRVILEWHVHKVATDRDALIAAIWETPDDSWDWRAVKAYAETPEGQKQLRLEFAVLLFPFSIEAHSTEHAAELESRFRKALTKLLATAERDVEWLAFPDEAFNPTLRLLDSQTRTYHRFFSRFASIVRPSVTPLFTSRDFAAYLLRLSDPRLPASVREEAEDSSALVLYFERPGAAELPSDHSTTTD